MPERRTQIAGIAEIPSRKISNCALASGIKDVTSSGKYGPQGNRDAPIAKELIKEIFSRGAGLSETCAALNRPDRET